jgi:hypothetical protein
MCQVTSMFAGSDHLLIKTTFLLETAICTTPFVQNCFKQTDVDTVQARAQWLQLPDRQLDLYRIDAYLDYLVHFIQVLIAQTVLKSQLSEHA